MRKAAQDFSISVAGSKGKEAPELSTIISRFISKLGGEHQFSDWMLEDFQKIRTEIGERPKLVMDWYKMMLWSIKAENEQRREDGGISQMTDEELELLVKSVAVKQMKEDPEFLKSVLRDVGVKVIEAEAIHA